MTTLDIRLKIGLRIKELRSEKGLSQEALANSIGMSRTYFAEVETGRRNVSAVNLERIIIGLDSTFNSFFSHEMFGEKKRMG